MAPITGDLSAEVDNYIKNNRIMIFSKSTCPFCNRVKNLFDSLDEKYFSLELNKLDNGREIQKLLASKIGRSSVPQVFVNGNHIGGCDDTMAAHNNGKLKEFLSILDEDDNSDQIAVGDTSEDLVVSK